MKMISSFYSLCEGTFYGVCSVINMLEIFIAIASIVFIIESTISAIVSVIRDSLPNREKPKEEDNKVNKDNYLNL